MKDRQVKFKAPRQQRIPVNAYAALLDCILARYLTGDEIKRFEYRPVELRYFDRRENNPTIICFASQNRWQLSGWHVDITTLQAYVLVRLLHRKRQPAIYQFWEDGLQRTVVVIHSCAGYAIVAEAHVTK